MVKKSPSATFTPLTVLSKDQLGKLVRTAEKSVTFNTYTAIEAEPSRIIFFFISLTYRKS